MELLAPAGGMDQLKAAIYFGADAVYIAGERFGMRARAHNFNNEEITEAVRFAHAHKAKLYVACNIFMDNNDIKALPSYLEFLNSVNVDALIISDLGAFKLAQKHAPNTDIHISTQLSISNAASANVFYEMGAKRIVCAREMSLNDIILMREQVNPELELEVFVHGAMCMAVSGRCLISAYLTGRSANKGNCAQSCRWKYALEEERFENLSKQESSAKFENPSVQQNYTLEEENRPGLHFPIEEGEHGSYIMNAQDLNMIEHLDELARAGVSSIKIEGRNKKAFYVASVVGAYRSVLDGESAAFANKELHKISHRPYSTGFFYNKAVQASDFEGYEMGARHMGDVLFCEPCCENEGSVATHENSAVEYENNNAAADTSATASPATDAATHESSAATQSFTLYFMCRNKIYEGDTIEILAPYQKPIAVKIKNLFWVNFADESIKNAFKEKCLDEESKENEQNRKNEEAENGKHFSPKSFLENIKGIYPHKVPEARRNCEIYSCKTDCIIPKHSYLRQILE